MYEYNRLVCQVSSEPKPEPLDGTNLKIESIVNAENINIAQDKHFHKKNALVSPRFEKS